MLSKNLIYLAPKIWVFKEKMEAFVFEKPKSWRISNRVRFHYLGSDSGKAFITNGVSDYAQKQLSVISRLESFGFRWKGVHSFMFLFSLKDCLSYKVLDLR